MNPRQRVPDELEVAEVLIDIFAFATGLWLAVLGGRALFGLRR